MRLQKKPLPGQKLDPIRRRKSTWTPVPYMLDAVRFLVSRAAAGLFLNPGFSKTAITLHAFLIRKEKKLAKKMLVIAKLRICELTWPSEIEKWNLPFKVCLLHGPKKDQYLEDDYDVYLLNFEGLPWFVKKHPSLIKQFEMMVIDESSRVKETSTQRFKLLRKILPHFKYRQIMTGSPMPKSLLNIFGQIYILDMGATFTPYISHFRNTYMYPAGYMGYEWLPKEGAEEKIYQKIAPLVLRLPPDLIKLPPLSYHNIEVRLPPAAAAKYERMEKTFVLDWKKGRVTAANAAVAAGKLRQIAGGALYVTDDENEQHVEMIHTEKIDALEELRDELSDQPMLVAYEYKHELTRLKRRFPDGETFDGLNKQEAMDLRDRFNAGQVPMLFGQPQSVAHGLNLQGSAKIVVWLTLTWSLELFEQFVRRIWRQGQKNHVDVYRILARGTLDFDIMELLDDDDKRQQRLLEALEKKYGPKGKSGKH